MDTLKDNYNPREKREYLKKKAEKLIGALYKITDFVSDNEPLKWKLRDRGLIFLLETMSFDEVSGGGSKKSLSDIVRRIHEINTLLGVSLAGSLVSQMNFLILSDEFKFFESQLLAYTTEFDKPLSLVVSQEEIERGIQREGEPTLLKDNSSIGHMSFIETKRHRSASMLLKGQKETRASTPRRDDKTQEERQTLIIDFVRKHKEPVSIKDILALPAFSNSVSEKTLQRVLVDMVFRGSLKKTGKRRWSRYYL